MTPVSDDWPERLETGRLVLRPYREDDAVWYCAMARRNHDHLARFESGNAAFGLADEAGAQAVLRSFGELGERREAHFLGVFLKESDTFVAQIYVGASDPARRRFTLGFFADCAHEGKGYVAEAARAVLAHLFGPMRASKVELWCDAANLRCRRVAERCGFVPETHLSVDKGKTDGSISGSCGYALCREQHATQQGVARGQPEAGPGAAPPASEPDFHAP